MSNPIHDFINDPESGDASGIVTHSFTMTPSGAVRQAIEARITQLNAQIEQHTQILTSRQADQAELLAWLEADTAHLDALETERDELAAALPEEVEE